MIRELKKQLKLMSGSLVDLSKQIEQISEYMDQIQFAEDLSKSGKKSSCSKKGVTQKADQEKNRTTKVTMLDMVFDSIKKSRNGITIPKLREKTGLEPKQLSNALFKLTNKGKIKPKERGIYIKA
ncbi:hypothetical protein BuS5_02524 [Desulfosarcina sp. BuS5]|uniref:hypothetical protein n=1 Tax=Desulfosarcina sp. BuS5 TaxID=933262 RepID=UPI0004848CE3|nr:hypothetical protein [Desulfosarcina sp. BuS5]WDN89556.1 hypothetical protein BuS5_02524 [Desulfosarcina sp. BuS5]